MIRTFIALFAAVFSFFVSPIVSGQGLTHQELVFDFGHVGIDFNLFHTFTYVNRTDQTVNISEVRVNCDCSTVQLIDSLIEPGDTAFFRLTFNTRDYYGPVSQFFRATTTDPAYPELKYFFVAIVGQWFHGLKPDPFSLFFLANKREITVSVPNLKFDEIQIADIVPHDTTFSVEVVEKEADKGEAIKLKVSPSKGLVRSTFLSSMTFLVEADGLDKPTILTVPIKIVKY